jgi:hypothetical protein
MESKQKTWAIIKQQWCFDHGGMQYNVYAFGGHPIFSAVNNQHIRYETNSNTTGSFIINLGSCSICEIRKD